MNEQLELWTGEFGDEYTRRNKISRFNTGCRAKALFWAWERMGFFGRVLEVGAGQGANALALKQCSEMFGTDLADYVGIEPNKLAFKRLKKVAKGSINAAWLDGEYTDSYPHGSFDVVLTMGMLIHVPEEELNVFIRKMFDSIPVGGHLIIFEYFSPQRTLQSEYHSEDNALWTDDYGVRVLKECPELDLVDYKFFWKRESGLDDLTGWVFKRRV
jgi:2-polyprenyl-3-methyl-5-hydroxy-6-metoxy-1,4-benzoquinol methylase